MSSQLIAIGIGSPANVAHLIRMGLSPNQAGPGNGFLISLAIGTPTDIAHLTLFGLSPNPVGAGGSAGVMRRIGYGGGLISV